MNCAPGVLAGLEVCIVVVLIRGGFTHTEDDDSPGLLSVALVGTPGLRVIFEPVFEYDEFQLVACGDCVFIFGEDVVVELE